LKKDPSKKELIEDLQRVFSERGGVVTQAVYRAHGEFSDKQYGKLFGTFAQFLKDGGLKDSRRQQKLKNDTAKHSAMDDRVEFIKSELWPYREKFKSKHPGRYNRIAVFSDLHDIERDQFAWDVFLDTCKRRQPDAIIANGDTYDFYEFSHYRHDPRKMKLVERLAFVRDNTWRPLRTALPDAEITINAGNHCDRVPKIFADKIPESLNLLNEWAGITMQNLLGLDEFGINWNSRLDLSEWKYDTERSSKNYIVYDESFVVCHEKNFGFGLSGTSGHIHRPFMESMWSVPMGRMTWTGTGCMCATDAEFVEQRGDWCPGFAFFTIDRLTKTVQPENIPITGRSVIVDGVLYERPAK